MWKLAISIWFIVFFGRICAMCVHEYAPNKLTSIIYSSLAINLTISFSFFRFSLSLFIWLLLLTQMNLFEPKIKTMNWNELLIQSDGKLLIASELNDTEINLNSEAVACFLWFCGEMALTFILIWILIHQSIS